MTDYPSAGARCANCGSQLIPDAKFCAICGQAVVEAQAPNTPPVWAAPAPAPAPIASDTVWTPADVPPSPPVFSGTQTLPAPQALPPSQTNYAPPQPFAYWQQPGSYAPPADGQTPPPYAFPTYGQAPAPSPYSPQFYGQAPAYPGYDQIATPARRSNMPMAIGLLVVGLALIVVACGLFVLAS